MKSGVLVFLVMIGLAGGGAISAQDAASAPEALIRAEEAGSLAGERQLEFFQAIAMDDQMTVQRMIAEGIDPNADLTPPVPKDFVAGFPDPRVRYFLSSERGFTPLMLATVLGNEILVRSLLAAGANPNLKTSRHKTFALWLAGKYGHLEIMRILMGIGPNDAIRDLYLWVDIEKQKARLFDGDEIILETPVSTGRKSHPTPSGWFIVTDKYESWVSTLYRAKMPYYLRLSCADFGLHAGALPGYPASHGCVRLPATAARKLFSLVPPGTLVGIE